MTIKTETDKTGTGPYMVAALQLREAMDVISALENGETSSSDALTIIAELLDAAYAAGHADGQNTPRPPAKRDAS